MIKMFLDFLSSNFSQADVITFMEINFSLDQYPQDPSSNYFFSLVYFPLLDKHSISYECN